MALTVVLLLLLVEAAGSVPCSSPALQTKVFKYRIWDMNQQSLYLRDDQLVAGHLPRGASSAPFTFFRSYKDGLWRFESAANPGWFLCTSSRSHQPVALWRCPDSSHVLDFYFQLCDNQLQWVQAAMAFVRSGCGARPVGQQRGWHRHQERPMGATMEAAAGDGDPEEAVVDPDMVDLFNDFHYVVRDTEHKGLFLRDGRLVAANTFEAAAFPGRFLCTFPQPDHELGLAPRAAPASITSFYLRRRRDQ